MLGEGTGGCGESFGGSGSARNRVGAGDWGDIWGACASLWGPVTCAFLFPISPSLHSPSISFGVSFGYYCVAYRFIVGPLVLLSSILYRLLFRMRICCGSRFVGGLLFTLR